MTPRNLEKKVSLLRRTMNLSDEDVRVILSKQPALLHYSADRNLAPTILFLVRALDLSKSELRSMVIDCPSILGYSLDNLRRKIAFFAALYANEENDGKDRIRQLLVATPKLLLAAVDTGLMPRMKFLHNEIQFSREELQRLYESNPKLLMYSLDGNLREKIVFFFILQLRMETKDVRKILLSYPQVMDYNLENHMKPLAEYCMTELEFSGDEFGSIILKFPRLFTYSLFRIKHVIGYLRYELELEPRQAKRVIFQAPQILGLGDDNVKEKLDLLRNRLDLSSNELGLVFSKMPTLICLGTNTTLIPKLDYLGDKLSDENHPNNQLLKETIIKQPTLLGYSLEGRINPRMERLIAAGVPPHKITVGISMSEENFERWLESSLSKTVTHSIVTRRNSTISGVLLKRLNFDEEELNQIYSEVVDISDWTVSSLKSWIRYLKHELNDIPDDELRNTILSYPQLIDRSFQRKVKHRLKSIHLAELPILEYLDTMYWPENEFNDWIEPRLKVSRSKISYIGREFALNSTERSSLLLKMPALEHAAATTTFQHRVQYFITNLGNSTNAVKQLMLESPSTFFDRSIKRTIEPRMRQIKQAGVSDCQQSLTLMTMDDDMFLANITFICLRNQYSDTIEALQSTLLLNQEETDSLLLSFATQYELSERGDNIIHTLSYLIDLAHGDTQRVRAAILKQPGLLLYYPKELENRVVERTSSLGTTEDAFSILIMSEEDYQKQLSLCVLQDMLNFTQKEIEVVLNGDKREMDVSVANKIDYLLSQGSKDDVKNVILSQPRLLRNPLEKLQNINVMATKEGVSATHRFWNESRVILQNTLGLAESDTNYVLSRCRYLSLRDPEDFLVPKLNYLLVEIENLTSCVLENPMLLDYSLNDWIKPRMELLIGTGLDPSQINDIISLSSREIEQRQELQTKFGFTNTELEHILPLKNWRRLRNTSEHNIQYLSSQLNSSIADLKKIVHEEPKLMTSSLSKTIMPRMELLVESGCAPTDISKVLTLPQTKVEEHCSKCCLCRKLGFTPKQMDNIFSSSRGSILCQSPSVVGEKVDYLLHNVFRSRKQKLKAALLSNPLMLKQSLNEIIQPRTVTLNYLASIGVEYSPSDIARLFSLSDSRFAKELVPQIITWSQESFEEVYDSISEKENILSMLKDFSPTAVSFAYADDANRELARVVHWR